MDVLEVFKWIGIVLAAGFVGYLGRYTAMLLLRRFHRDAEGTGDSAGETERTSGGKDSAKIEKKRAKQEVKQAKKHGADYHDS